MVERISSAYNIEGSAHTKAKENNRQPCAHADISAHTENEAFSLAGAFAPPALKGVDNPTFAHRPLARPVDKQGYPPHALPPCLKSFFLFFLSNTEGGSRCRRTAGGLQAPRGTGGAAPCRGSPLGRRGTRWGVVFSPAPLWGALCCSYVVSHAKVHRYQMDITRATPATRASA
jgi:hypothetical protein